MGYVLLYTCRFCQTKLIDRGFDGVTPWTEETYLKWREAICCGDPHGDEGAPPMYSEHDCVGDGSMIGVAELTGFKKVAPGD